MNTGIEQRPSQENLSPVTPSAPRARFIDRAVDLVSQFHQNEQGGDFALENLPTGQDLARGSLALVIAGGVTFGADLALKSAAQSATNYRVLVPAAPRLAGIGSNSGENPTPTATPDTRPNTPWFPELAEQLNNLSILDRTQLAHYIDRSQIPYPDIYQMFTSDGSGNADVPRRLVHILASEKVQREWLILIAGHELAHFHQAEQSRQIGMDPDASPNFQQWYLNTSEGREFVEASRAAIEYGQANGIDMTSPFVMHSPFGADDYEDSADVITHWFNRPSALDGPAWSQMRAWATKWLDR